MLTPLFTRENNALCPFIHDLPDPSLLSASASETPSRSQRQKSRAFRVDLSEICRSRREQSSLQLWHRPALNRLDHTLCSRLYIAPTMSVIGTPNRRAALSTTLPVRRPRVV